MLAPCYNPAMTIEPWALEHPKLRVCTSAEFMYDEMASQSGRSLPVVYRDFDLTRREDWHDEGCILDFLCCVGADDARILDFGPGDGWPSLRIAPSVGEVIGVDTSERRIEECRSNAGRLGLRNARFVRVEAGADLPFEDASFDGITAASSIEQSVDPSATVAELHRVLRPGGTMRLAYEGLRRYAGARERLATVAGWAGGSAVEVYERDIAGESALMIRVCTPLDPHTLRKRLAVPSGPWLDLDRLSIERLDRLKADIVEVRVCRLRHPSGKTWVTLCEEAGFSAAGTHSGAEAARRLFGSGRRRFQPATHAELTAYLFPVVDSVVTMDAPLNTDPWITAVKPAGDCTTGDPPT